MWHKLLTKNVACWHKNRAVLIAKTIMAISHISGAMLSAPVLTNIQKLLENKQARTVGKISAENAYKAT
jgi:hypothetical protein